MRAWRPPDGRLRRRGFEDHLTHLPFTLRDAAPRRRRASPTRSTTPTRGAAIARGRPDGVDLPRRPAPQRPGEPARLRLELVRARPTRRARRSSRSARPPRRAFRALARRRRRGSSTRASTSPPSPPAASAPRRSRSSARPTSTRRTSAPALLLEAFALVRRERPGARLVARSAAARRRRAASSTATSTTTPRSLAAYREAYVTALASRGEAFGLVLVEALACGTPAVGDRGGRQRGGRTDHVRRHGRATSRARSSSRADLDPRTLPRARRALRLERCAERHAALYADAAASRFLTTRPAARRRRLGGAARPRRLGHRPHALRDARPLRHRASDERFTADTWVVQDICTPWPFADGQFDFAVCSHTLEDVRDPVFVCNGAPARREGRLPRGPEPDRGAHDRPAAATGPAGPTTAGSARSTRSPRRSRSSTSRTASPAIPFKELPIERRVQWLRWEGSFAHERADLHGRRRAARLVRRGRCTRSSDAARGYPQAPWPAIPSGQGSSTRRRSSTLAAASCGRSSPARSPSPRRRAAATSRATRRSPSPCRRPRTPRCPRTTSSGRSTRAPARAPTPRTTRRSSTRATGPAASRCSSRR